MRLWPLPPLLRAGDLPKTKQEIEKLGTGLNKLNEEDPTFSVTNNAETHQTVISGAGDIQIDVLCSKLKSRFGVDSELDTPACCLS